MKKNIITAIVIADTFVAFGIAGGIECGTISLVSAVAMLAVCFVVMFVAARVLVNMEATEMEIAARRSARLARRSAMLADERAADVLAARRSARPVALARR